MQKAFESYFEEIANEIRRKRQILPFEAMAESQENSSESGAALQGVQREGRDSSSTSGRPHSTYTARWGSIGAYKPPTFMPSVS